MNQDVYQAAAGMLLQVANGPTNFAISSPTTSTIITPNPTTQQQSTSTPNKVPTLKRPLRQRKKENLEYPNIEDDSKGDEDFVPPVSEDEEDCRKKPRNNLSSKNKRWSKIAKDAFDHEFGKYLTAGGKYPDVSLMAAFAKRYSLSAGQVKIRIMNERKFHKENVASTAKEMEMEL